jgi:riboflavin synthase
MFTGLVEEVGKVLALHATDGGVRLRLAAPRIAGSIQTGDSIAVNGCCLTVTARNNDELSFDLLEETLRCTNLRMLHQDDGINLERALAADGRLGGHFVQGHIDCAAAIIARDEKGADLRIETDLPAEFARFVIPKGSIAVNGISLTVAEILPNSFVVWIIPHTRAETNLAAARQGDLVNLEFDLLAKYVDRMLDRRAVPPA